MSKENLKLWTNVSKTDPTMTKKARLNGVGVTSIDAYYQIMNATEQFGSYGNGWGLKDVTLAYQTIGDTTLCTLQGVFFYGENEFSVINAINVAYKVKGKEYMKIDSDYAKKLETNTITKALSRLGFNADIFLGKFEDDVYVANVKAEIKATKEIEDLNKKPINTLNIKELGLLVRHELAMNSNQVVADMLSEKQKNKELTEDLLRNTLKTLRDGIE